ncbi:MAG: tetratricopeptide repeat protein [Anaerolineae bacterium]
MENPLLHNAIESAKLGFYDDARGLLLQIIRQEPNNALAWLWLAQTLDDPKRQADCLSQALRIEPDNPDALAAVEALRAGMPLPEPGGGVVEEPEPEFIEPDEMFNWGVLSAEEPEAEPEVEALPEAEPDLFAPADISDWGELYTEEPESAPELEPELETEPYTDDDMFGWGDLFAEEPEPEAPVVEEPVPVEAPPPLMSFIGMEEEEPPPEPEPVVPESTPEPEESFLQRARRLRTQGFAPAPEPEEPAAPPTSVPPFIEAPAPEVTPVSQEPAAEVVEEPSAAPAPSPERRFRIFDRRVLFSILGLIQLPILIGMLVWYFFLRGPSVSESAVQFQPLARSLPRPALGTCRALDLEEFTLVETLGGKLTVDTVFTGTQVAITETLVVPEGVRLLIYPGATLVFTSEASLEVHGTLYACGNADAPVTFSAFDKAPGGWEGIRLYNRTEATVLSHAVVEYAGERALYIANSVPMLADLTIAHSALFPVSLDGSVVPDLSDHVSIADNPVNGIEIRPGTLQVPNAVWPYIKGKDSPPVYVLPGLLRVDEGATLEIQSGVIVKFWHAPQGQLPGIWVHGLLQAEGALFTSVYDSAEDAGGTTYMEAIDPQPGDWGSLTFFESSEKSYLRDVVIRYAGRARGAVTMQASSPELKRVTITSSAGYPLSADARSFPALEAMTLEDNAAGNGLEVYGGLSITGEGTYVWELLGGSTQVVRVVRDAVTVGPDAMLKVQPGVVVKFTGRGRMVVQGALSAIAGSDSAEQIVFTSLHDDEYGGDTDGATVPGDDRVWQGIILEGVDDTTELQNVFVRYAPITLLDASPKLFSNRIALAPGAGLRMTPGSSPDMRGARFEDNGLNGIAILTGTLTTDQEWIRLGGAGEDQIVRVLEGEITVGPGAVLEIEPDVVIKANPVGKLVVLGHLSAKGRADQLVVFTSLNDDVRGGDTNRRPLNAGAGDWPGIEIGPEGNAHLAYVGIYYAEVGLNVQGTSLPAIDEGRVHIAYGKQPLACTERIEIPPAYFFEYNEVEVTRCPSP